MERTVLQFQYVRSTNNAVYNYWMTEKAANAVSKSKGWILKKTGQLRLLTFNVKYDYYKSY